MKRQNEVYRILYDRFSRMPCNKLWILLRNSASRTFCSQNRDLLDEKMYWPLYVRLIIKLEDRLDRVKKD